MTTLVARLRAYDGFEGGHSDAAEANAYELIVEAADHIEALEKALEPFASIPLPAAAKPHWPLNYQAVPCTFDDVIRAREVLSASTDKP